MTIKIKLRESGRVVDAPTYTGLIMFEMGVGELYPSDEFEKEALLKLLKLKKKKYSYITHAVPPDPILKDNVWDDIEDQKDPNSPTKKKLRVMIKDLIERSVWDKPYFTNREIFKLAQNSNDEFLKEHLQSVPPRIRELYKLRFLARVLKDGKEVAGHYIIMKENWNQQMEDVVY